MSAFLPFVIVGLVMSCLYLLSSSRLAALIKTVGAQGIFLAFVPFATGSSLSDPHTWILFLSSFIIKGIVIPLFLFRALRGVAINKEVQPYLGFAFSIIVGVMIVFSSFIVHHFISPMPMLSSPMIPAAVAVAFCGLFVIIARKQALTQVIGYLVFENGIYMFGVSLAVNNPLLVELGILLDVLVGVFVMGIVIYHINREFDSISTQELNMLRE